MTDFQQHEDNVRPKAGRVSLPGHVKFHTPPAKAQWVFWSIAVGGFFLDIWSKSAVFNWLLKKEEPFFSIIDGFLRLVVAENSGAAFGIAAGHRYFLVTVSMVAIAVILFLFFFTRVEHKIMYVALGLFIGGVAGNLYDRIFNNGMVRDFIDIVYWPGKHWPAFNVADSMLCVGVGLMLVSSFLTERLARKHAQQQK